MAFFGADMNVSTDQITWFTFYCHQEGRPYYYDPMSGNTTWSLPNDGILSNLPGAPMDRPPPPKLIFQPQTQQPISPSSTANDEEEDEQNVRKDNEHDKQSADTLRIQTAVWKILCVIFLAGNVVSWGLLFGEPACIDGIRDSSLLLASNAQSHISKEFQFVSTGLENMALYAAQVYDTSLDTVQKKVQAVKQGADDSIKAVQTAATDQWSAAQRQQADIVQRASDSYQKLEESVRLAMEKVTGRKKSTSDAVQSNDVELQEETVTAKDFEENTDVNEEEIAAAEVRELYADEASESFIVDADDDQLDSEVAAEDYAVYQDEEEMEDLDAVDEESDEQYIIVNENVEQIEEESSVSDQELLDDMAEVSLPLEVVETVETTHETGEVPADDPDVPVPDEVFEDAIVADEMTEGVIEDIATKEEETAAASEDANEEALLTDEPDSGEVTKESEETNEPASSHEENTITDQSRNETAEDASTVYVSVEPEELKPDKPIEESSLDRILKMATKAGVTIDPSSIKTVTPRPPLLAAMCPNSPELRALLSHCKDH